MPIVESTIEVYAPLDTVWKLAQDIEKYPSIMPDLDSVAIVEEEQLTPDTRRVVSEWHARIKQLNRKIDWTEEDIWNSVEHTCHFWQLRGDFDDYRGEYSFRDVNGRTAVRLQMEYKFEVPLIGRMMQKIIQKLMQDNCENMLRSLRDEAQRRAR